MAQSDTKNRMTHGNIRLSWRVWICRLRSGHLLKIQIADCHAS